MNTISQISPLTCSEVGFPTEGTGLSLVLGRDLTGHVFHITFLLAPTLPFAYLDRHPQHMRLCAHICTRSSRQATEYQQRTFVQEILCNNPYYVEM